ncbi:uncharacterized protein C8R40DRAFT_1174883 [Lentinula edodes]|uniref:uncharacterized protein n=1 Tax=Lentinula edodes TaxID=5353 RepID=UPI001E8E4E6C|nr:uncharacterized protein C8R40DRAFT_1174883 [Lentinula edodes]KAH7871188.1 hypothetical protein C8R40DRAFT_1174883 [Lentinula edodes]
MTPNFARISSEDLAQLQSSVQILDLPSRQDFSKVEARFADKSSRTNHLKSFLPRRNYDYIKLCLETPKLKGVVVTDFELVSKDIVLGGKGDLFLLSSESHSSLHVLLWKGRVVVPQDQVYDVLQYCHRKSDHGDFSGTLAIVREYYTFVPSILVRGFVDACPTCTAKRALNNVFSYAAPDINNATSFSNSFDLLAVSNSQDEELSTLPTSSPFIFSGLDFEDSHPMELPVPPPLFSRLSTGSRGSHDGLPQSLPMSREVSLFQGIPNGWQYFTDYDVAHKDFVEHKDEVMSQQLKPPAHQKRPRIPSIAPLNTTNTNSGGRADVNTAKEKGVRANVQIRNGGSECDIPTANPNGG